MVLVNKVEDGLRRRRGGGLGRMHVEAVVGDKRRRKVS
jgi:hypothetical protein